MKISITLFEIFCTERKQPTIVVEMMLIFSMSCFVAFVNHTAD